MMKPEENYSVSFVIGICGVTCGGKTTVASHLNKIIPNSQLFTQDDYFLDPGDPRHTWIPELNHINFDILSSLDMEKMHKDLLECIGDCRTIKHCKKHDVTGNKMNLHHIQTFIHKRVSELKIKIILVEGFSVLNYKPIAELCALKYYFLLSKEECYKRRLTRVYDPPDCPGYFEKCVWPEHLEHLKEVRATVKDVKYFDENTVNPIDKILADIAIFL